MSVIVLIRLSSAVVPLMKRRTRRRREIEGAGVTVRTIQPVSDDRPIEVIRRFGLGDEDLAAWRESGLGDADFDTWLTDRVARRPTGSRARAVYGAEDAHSFARRAILEALALGADDHLLEVGCGGGLLLRDALATGASTTGIDHSEEMVALARERAPNAPVVLAEAGRLPFDDATFTALAMSIVFFFFDDPVSVLQECRRVLRPDGALLRR
jgi:SAM-dependent methyltransferase